MFWFFIFVVIFFVVIVPIAETKKKTQHLEAQCKLLHTQNKALQVRCLSYKQFVKYSQIADAEATANC